MAEFAETVRDYKRYTDRFLQPTRKAGILIDHKQDANSPYQPEVLQLIKDALRAGGYAPYELTPDMSDDQDFIRKDFFDTYFSRASTLEHLCALAMAGDHQLRTLTSIQHALERYEVNATLNQVDAALERLVDLRNILERTSDGYDFAVTAFPKIIARSRRLSDWIGLRREVFVPVSYTHLDVYKRQV